MANEAIEAAREALQNNEGEEAIKRALRVLKDEGYDVGRYWDLWPYDVATETVTDQLKNLAGIEPELVDQKLGEMGELAGAARAAEEAGEEAAAEGRAGAEELREGFGWLEEGAEGLEEGESAGRKIASGLADWYRGEEGAAETVVEGLKEAEADPAVIKEVENGNISDGGAKVIEDILERDAPGVLAGVPDLVDDVKELTGRGELEQAWVAKEAEEVAGETPGAPGEAATGAERAVADGGAGEGLEEVRELESGLEEFARGNHDPFPVQRAAETLKEEGELSEEAANEIMEGAANGFSDLLGDYTLSPETIQELEDIGVNPGALQEIEEALAATGEAAAREAGEAAGDWKKASAEEVEEGFRWLEEDVPVTAGKSPGEMMGRIKEAEREGRDLTAEEKDFLQSLYREFRSGEISREGKEEIANFVTSLRADFRMEQLGGLDTEFMSEASRFTSDVPPGAGGRAAPEEVEEGFQWLEGEGGEAASEVSGEFSEKRLIDGLERVLNEGRYGNFKQELVRAGLEDELVEILQEVAAGNSSRVADILNEETDISLEALQEVEETISGAGEIGRVTRETAAEAAEEGEGLLSSISEKIENVNPLSTASGTAREAESSVIRDVDAALREHSGEFAVTQALEELSESDPRGNWDKVLDSWMNEELTSQEALNILEEVGADERLLNEALGRAGGATEETAQETAGEVDDALQNLIGRIEGYREGHAMVGPSPIPDAVDTLQEAGKIPPEVADELKQLEEGRVFGSELSGEARAALQELGLETETIQWIEEGSGAAKDVLAGGQEAAAAGRETGAVASETTKEVEEVGKEGAAAGEDVVKVSLEELRELLGTAGRITKEGGELTVEGAKLGAHYWYIVAIILVLVVILGTIVGP